VQTCASYSLLVKPESTHAPPFIQRSWQAILHRPRRISIRHYVQLRIRLRVRGIQPALERVSPGWQQHDMSEAIWDFVRASVFQHVWHPGDTTSETYNCIAVSNLLDACDRGAGQTKGSSLIKSCHSPKFERRLPISWWESCALADIDKIVMMEHIWINA